MLGLLGRGGWWREPGSCSQVAHSEAEPAGCNQLTARPTHYLTRVQSTPTS